MAEVVGTVSAIVGLIAVLGKMANTLSSFRSQWRDADLAVLTFETQLIAMRGAFTKIEQWAASIDPSSDPPHHQLIIDLDRCVQSCSLLLAKLNAEISQFVNLENKLDTMNKLKLVFNTKGLQDVQKMIEAQTTALTLLLTACNCNALTEQNVLLQKQQSRKILSKVQDDAASLAVLRDVDSIFSGFTGQTVTSSKRSLVFDFDSELFKSRIYQTWIRGSVKTSLLKQQGFSREEMARSREIDRALKQDLDAIRGRKEVTGLLFNAQKSSKVTFLEACERMGLVELPAAEAEASKEMIYRSLIRCAKSVAFNVRRSAFAPDNPAIGASLDLLDCYEVDMRDPLSYLGVEFANAFLAGLAAKPHQEQLEEYFAREAMRICEKGYRPTLADVLQCTTLGAKRVRQIQLRGIPARGSPMSLYDVDLTWGESSKKWIHQFEGVTTICFIADLDCYHRTLLEDETVNEMMVALQHFESFISSRWFVDSSVIILLSNSETFRDKLDSYPLASYFPDYTGPEAYASALEYIKGRFLQAVHPRPRRGAVCHVMESGDWGARRAFVTLTTAMEEAAYVLKLRAARLLDGG